MASTGNYRSKGRTQAEGELQPLQNRLMACLKNEKVADVYLVGDDGKRIPALRCVLSCTSPVFEAMLYGEFSESKKAVIPIEGCNSSVLQNLVDYCCSDQVPSLALTKGDPVSMVAESILLAELGDKYQIPGLEGAVVKSIMNWIQEDPSLACVAFELSHSDATPAVRAAAWQVIVKRPFQALPSNAPNLRGGITCLSPSKLLELFECAEQIRATPLFMCQRLLEWYRSRPANKGKGKEPATEICRTAAGHIHLAGIAPHELKKLVDRAPFIDRDDILQAFMEQAIQAYKFGLDFSVDYKHGDQPQCRHVMVEGAGMERINGIYVQDDTTMTALIRQQFTKRNKKEGEQIFLVQGREDGLWFICDPAQYYYHCKFPEVLPWTGWTVVEGHGVAPAPSCKFFFFNDFEDESNFNADAVR